MIESIQNSKVKEWKKLHIKKNREKNKKYIIEGFHLVEEAIRALPIDDIEVIMVRKDVSADMILGYPEEKIQRVSNQVADHIADTTTTQGVFAIIHKRNQEIPSEVKGPILLLDGVQDPGNVGTMIRTAAAAGFSGVVLGEGTVDLYNMKTLRSAQGSHFYLDIFEGKLNEWITELKKIAIPIYGTALDKKAKSHYELPATTDPFALIMGNEGLGMQENHLQMTDQNIYIPIADGAESLNVAIAAGILMFHLHRLN